MMKKAQFSEDDAASLLKRYSSNTLLTFLQEVSSCESSNLNWEILVKKSNTGIKSAQEYQALWHHLAYRTELAEHYADDAEPLDDESDLEFEVEPFPCVSRETAAEAENVVQALDAPNFGTGRKGTSLPIGSWDAGTISQHYGTVGASSSLLGMNPPSASPLENTCKAGSTGLVHSERRKRKLWTPEEDQELIAAVEEYGEGNWTHILKRAFRHDRTASQLSQRWALIRKHRDVKATNLVTGPGQLSIAQGSEEVPDTAPKFAATVGAVSNASSTRTGTSTAIVQRKAHTQGIARNSASLSKTLKTLPVGQARLPNVKTANLGSSAMGGRLIAPGAVVMSAAAAQAASIGGSEMWQATTLPASCMSSPVAGTGKLSSTSSWNNTAASGGRGSLKPPVGPDPMVQAAAVAAGARIAPASAAASLLKAAQSGNIVHMRPGVPLTKSGFSSQALSSTRISTSANVTRGPSVHYIRTGSGALPPIIPNMSMNAPKSGPQQLKQQFGKSSGNVQAAHSIPKAAVQMTSPQASPSLLNVHSSSQAQSSIIHLKSPAQTSVNAPAIKSRTISLSSVLKASSNSPVELVDPDVSGSETPLISSVVITNSSIPSCSTSLAIVDTSQVSEAIGENLDLPKTVSTSFPSCPVDANASTSSPTAKEADQIELLLSPVPSHSTVENKMELSSTPVGLKSPEDGSTAILKPVSPHDGISALPHTDTTEKVTAEQN